MAAVLQLADIHFRPMGRADLEQVFAIETEAYEFPWSERIFQDCLRVGYSCWVIESWSGIHGYGIMAVALGECHLLNLCIDPRYQGHGLGRRLLRHLLDIARGHRAERAYLEVRPSNLPARRLYHREGFVEIGRRKGYYPAEGGREDAVVLARDLTFAPSL
jgi:ribosomal-protein-alanine N-acetyltransferase